MADAARELAGRFGVRRGRRAAMSSAPSPVRCRGARSGRGVHRQAAGAARRSGAYACRRVGADHLLGGRPGVGGFLARTHRGVPAGERAGGRDRVRLRSPGGRGTVGRLPHPGSRTAGAHRRARRGASPDDEQRGDLCPGVLGPAEGAGDDPIPDGGAARPRRAAGS